MDRWRDQYTSDMRINRLSKIGNIPLELIDMSILCSRLFYFNDDRISIDVLPEEINSSVWNLSLVFYNAETIFDRLWTQFYRSMHLLFRLVLL